MYKNTYFEQDYTIRHKATDPQDWQRRDGGNVVTAQLATTLKTKPESSAMPMEKPSRYHRTYAAKIDELYTSLSAGKTISNMLENQCSP